MSYIGEMGSAWREAGIIPLCQSRKWSLRSWNKLSCWHGLLLFFMLLWWLCRSGLWIAILVDGDRVVPPDHCSLPAGCLHLNTVSVAENLERSGMRLATISELAERQQLGGSWKVQMPTGFPKLALQEGVGASCSPGVDRLWLPENWPCWTIFLSFSGLYLMF